MTYCVIFITLKEIDVMEFEPPRFNYRLVGLK
nr:MAG TPA: hypothetical protein [Caudoviricetes sp.]